MHEFFSAEKTSLTHMTFSSPSTLVCVIADDLDMAAPSLRFCRVCEGDLDLKFEQLSDVYYSSWIFRS